MVASRSLARAPPDCDHGGELSPIKLRLRLQAPRGSASSGRRIFLRTFQFCRCGAQRGGRLSILRLQACMVRACTGPRGNAGSMPLRATEARLRAHFRAHFWQESSGGLVVVRRRRPSSATGQQREPRRPEASGMRMQAPLEAFPLARLRFLPPHMPEPEAGREDRVGHEDTP